MAHHHYHRGATRSRCLLLALLTSTVGISACSTTGPLPAASPDTTPSAAIPPTIAAPIPAQALTGPPCGILFPEEVRYFLRGAADAGTAQDSATAKGCQWVAPGGDPSFSVLLPRTGAHGLGELYASKTANSFFQELKPVQGYPIVAYGDKDNRPRTCQVAVGVRDDAMVSVGWTSPGNRGYGDACDTARLIGDTVVGALLGGA